VGLHLVRAEKARRSLREFVKQSWPLAERREFIDSWYVGAICDHLEAVSRGQIRKLLINIPPGHGKSLLVCVFWPAWVWTWRPQWRGLFCSYAEDLAVRDSVRCRSLLESEWYMESFSAPSGWSIRHDSNQKDLYYNTETGFRLALSVGGQGTGYRANTVVVDDPIKATDVLSKAEREHVTYWWDQQMSSRLDDPEQDGRVIVMQRLHEEDLAGYVLAKGGYEHLCLPSEFNPSYRARTYIDMSGRRELFFEDPRTEEGELLCPQRYSRTAIEEAKKDLADGYQGQHQQRPTPMGGGMFRVADWRFWKPDGQAPDHIVGRPRGCYEGPARPLPDMERVIISVDATFKRTATGSFVAIHVWGTSGAHRFLLDRVHERMDFDETLHALRGVIRRWPQAREKVIEAKANGDAIMSTLVNQHGISGVIAENPGAENKEQRASAMLPYQRAGNVHLPDGAPWLAEYIGEHAAFPLGRTNDDVDAQSQALKHLESPETVAELWARADW